MKNIPEKLYECPACGGKSTAAEWDKKTMDYYSFFNEEAFGIESGQKDECYYLCPKCKAEIDGEEIT